MHISSANSSFLHAVGNFAFESTCRQEALAQPAYVKDRRILLRILSNYGDPGRVSCTEILPIGSSNVPIPVTSLRYVKRSLINPAPLEPLVDGHMFQTDRTKIWQQQWPPEPPETTLDLVFAVRNRDVAALRVWPNTFEPKKNIRRIEVYLDGTPVYVGQLNDRFGSVVTFDAAQPEAALLKPPGDWEEDVNVEEFPSLSFQQLEFVVISSSDRQRKEFALKGIRLYNLDGSIHYLGQKVAYDMANCENAVSPQYLFTDTALTQENIFFQAWKAGMGNERPRVSLRFPFSTKIAAIEIINSRIPEDGSPSIAVRSGAVYLDGRNIWAGRLRRMNTESSGSCLERDDSTFVFLTDDPQIRDKVRNTSDPKRTMKLRKSMRTQMG
jgi:hypothetical protein